MICVVNETGRTLRVSYEGEPPETIGTGKAKDIYAFGLAGGAFVEAGGCSYTYAAFDIENEDFYRSISGRPEGDRGPGKPLFLVVLDEEFVAHAVNAVRQEDRGSAPPLNVPGFPMAPEVVCE